MSLQASLIAPVPEETTRIARAAFPKDNLYLSMRDELGIAFSDKDFIELFPRRGQPAFAPWRLALVTVMQFLENLSDRQAADAVRSRIDWKYALGLELTDAGFDYSVLSGFRERLASGGKQTLLLDRMLELFKGKKLLKAKGKQRTDSTHVLAAIRVLNRLEMVVETMRAALNQIASVAPDWLAQVSVPEWFERYSRRAEQSRLPTGTKAREAFAARGLDATQFEVDWDNQKVLCPAGKRSADWLECLTKDPYSRRVVKVKFRRRDCFDCENRTRCVRSKTGAPRQLLLQSREFHEALKETRVMFSSETGRREYQQRAGVEGTLSQGIRRGTIRRSRYIGLQKTHLQEVATASGINILRSINFLHDKPIAKTRVSRFARLAH